MAKSFAIVAEEYEAGKYRISHISKATHLLVYLEGDEDVVPYRMHIEKDKNPGPVMREYLKGILKKSGLKKIAVLASVRKIQVDGPWEKNDIYEEGSDAMEIARNYLGEMEKELYKDDV